MFALSTIDEQGQIRHFTFRVNDLETSLACLDDIMTRGHMLLRVLLIDKTGTSYLPIESFSNLSACTQLRQLELEWKTILSNPPDSSPPTERNSGESAQQFIGYLETLIVKEELRITEFEILLQRIEKPTLSEHLKLHNDILIASYSRLLAGCYVEVTRLHEIRHRLLNRLAMVLLEWE